MITLQYDGEIDLATGRNRKETHWQNKSMLWSAFVERLSQTHRTAETFAEYTAAKPVRKAEVKDIGGFVAGYITQGRRKTENVLHRSCLTLDLDYADADVWAAFTLCYDNAAALYSTHSHCPETPRYRLILPLARPVGREECVAIGRRVAGCIGIEQFDATTYEPARLMYWPSTAKDGAFVFERQDGPWLDPDDVLASYKNWRDASEWPVSDREQVARQTAASRQADPTQKPGIVGAFCRTYGIEAAIETFLPDVYEACDIPGRYTYRAGTTAGGLVVYDNDLFAYSHHGTDPTAGMLCNAFDLVRIHKFGLQDEGCREDTPANRRPSYQAMEGLALADEQVRATLGRERIKAAGEDFAEVLGDGDDWLAQMECDRRGRYLATIGNVRLILEHDPKLRGAFYRDRFELKDYYTRPLPWHTADMEPTGAISDEDETNLRAYLEAEPWHITGRGVIADALEATLSKFGRHPVREYLNALNWDGVPRIDTLFIDYLGAPDTPFVRAATRKMLAAAVTRVYQPGSKFDSAVVLVGPQGVGKSTILHKLGGPWYSDSFGTVQGKEAAEQLQGVWLLEMGELAGLRKSDVEAVKLFISKSSDRYRPAYGKRVVDFPRQCIMVGTTNTPDFLRDPSGNRRFWPITVRVDAPSRSVWDDLTAGEIGQIWAEAREAYRAHEPLYLSPEVERAAREAQEEAREVDEREGIVREFLDRLLPEEWPTMSLPDRRGWLTDPLSPAGTVRRDKVCVAEVWCECFGYRQGDLKQSNTRELNAILRKVPGWFELGRVERFGKTYGLQKSYRRAEK